MGKQVETSNELWLEVMETKCSASTAVLCSSFFPYFFAWKHTEIVHETQLSQCSHVPWNSHLTEYEGFSSWTKRQEPELLSDVRPPFLAPGLLRAIGKGKWQVIASYSTSASFVFQREAVLHFVPRLSFCHVSFLLPVTLLVSSLFFFFWFWGEGTRAALAIPEADVPWIHTVAKSYFSLLRILSFCFSFFLTAIERWGGIFIELAIKTSRCIS